MQSRWSFPSHRLERAAKATANPERGCACVKRWYSDSAMGLDGGSEEVKADTPAHDLEGRQDDGQHKPNPGAMNDAAGGVPIADCDVQGHGRRDQREIENEQRNGRQ